MRGEQSVDETDVVANKQPEGQAQNSRTGDQASIQPCKSVSRKREGQRDHAGDQHHARYGAHAEDQQIEHGPFGLADRAQDQ